MVVAVGTLHAMSLRMQCPYVHITSIRYHIVSYHGVDIACNVHYVILQCPYVILQCPYVILQCPYVHITSIRYHIVSYHGVDIAYNVPTYAMSLRAYNVNTLSHCFISWCGHCMQCPYVILQCPYVWYHYATKISFNSSIIFVISAPNN
jgi:hypothetical protein